MLTRGMLPSPQSVAPVLVQRMVAVAAAFQVAINHRSPLLCMNTANM